MDRLTPEAAHRKCLGACQLALSCDPIVLFEGVPDLVLIFTILSSGHSFCDQVRSWGRVKLSPPRTFGVKIHKLANLEFVCHARIEPSVCYTPEARCVGGLVLSLICDAAPSAYGPQSLPARAGRPL